MSYRSKWVFIVLILIGAQWTDARSQETVAPPECPVITVSCPDSDPDSLLTFKAQVSGVVLAGKLTFSWSVSAGVITSGQGTDSIKVDTSEASGQSVTATVEVNGLPMGCANKASCSTAVVRDPVATKIDEYGNISLRNQNARLDRLAKELQDDPSALGYILSYAGRRARAGEAQGRAERAKRYLVMKRGLDPGRIIIVDGGNREMPTLELFIVPIGVTPPVVSPTVKPDDAEIVGRRRKRPVSP